MIDFGTVRPGTDLVIPFHTFSSDDPSVSMTITSLTTADIEVYKNGSNTQRASDTGYALLDDGIDFDATVGIHAVSIDLSSNATDGFYAAGSQYFVVIGPITLDTGTVQFVAATFRIGYENAILNTTLLVYSTATSFTINPPASADDDAYNGCIMVAHDKADKLQTKIGFVSDYTGVSATITLLADPGIFTLTAGDNISLFLPSNVAAVNETLVIGIGTSGDKWRA